ncbi:hypothetical protein Efla_004311 [Eimeria flavescens]
MAERDVAGTEHRWPLGVPGRGALGASPASSGGPAQSAHTVAASPQVQRWWAPPGQRFPGLGPSHEGAPQGMAVIASVIEVGSDPPIKGLDPLVSEVCGRPLWRVPVMRVYGPWGLGGPLCCLHIHGFFPYFYVAAPPEAYGEGATQFLRAFARSLVLHADRLMASRSPAGASATSRIGAPRRNGGGASPKGEGAGPLVYKIEVVRRLPFYGYHREMQAFLKISLTKPKMVGALAALLLQGAVTGAPMQPYEVHFNFEPLTSFFRVCLSLLLRVAQTQFLADLHLRGMDAVYVRGPVYRAPVPLDLLSAAGFKGALWRGPFDREARHGESPPPQRGGPSVLDVLGPGAPSVLNALGWGQLVKHLSHMGKAAAAAAASATKSDAAAATSSCDTGAAAESGSGTSSNSSSSGPASRFCEKILETLPPKNPHGLRFLGAPRRSKCAIEADARVDQVLNPIVAAEKAAAAAAEAQQQQQQKKTQEGGEGTEGKQPQLTLSPNTHSCSSSSTGSSNSAFAARLLGSVSDYWTEEGARASAWGFPPPSAGTGGPHLQGPRDPQGASAPDFCQAALSSIIHRLGEWQQLQQGEQQQRGGATVPLQRITGHPQPRRQQQWQQRGPAPEHRPPDEQSRGPPSAARQRAPPPLGFSQVWEASQGSAASEADSDAVLCSQGASAGPFASADRFPGMVSTLPQGPLGGSHHWEEGVPFADAHGVEGPHQAARILADEAPPSQRAPVVFTQAPEGPPSPADGFSRLASLNDEDFAALLASQGPQGPPNKESWLGAPAAAPVEEGESLGSCSADCSSLSDSGVPRRHQKSPGDDNGIVEAAAEASAAAGGAARSCSSSCCKRCSSDLEDLLLAFEGKRAKDGRQSLRALCGAAACGPSSCSSSNSSSSKGNNSSSSSIKAMGDALQGAAAEFGVSGAPESVSQDALDSPETEALMAVSAAAKTAAASEAAKAAAGAAATAATAAAAAVAAAEATAAAAGADRSLEAAGSCSSAYAPTVRLGAASSCEDLSPTQSSRSRPGVSQQQQTSHQRTAAGASEASGEAAAEAAAEPATEAVERTAAEEKAAAAAAASLEEQDLGTSATAEAAAEPASGGGSSTKKHKRSSSSSTSREGRSRGAAGPVSASDSDDSVVSVSHPAAAAAARAAAAEEEQEILPFFSNPLDVPAAANPLKATPGGRLLLLQQQGLMCPPCACKKQTSQGGARLGRSELRTHLLRFIRKNQQQQQQQRQRMQQAHQQQQQQHGEASACFVYFRPPPDRAQVFASCPLKTRRKWRQAMQQQQLLQRQARKSSADAPDAGSQMPEAEQPDQRVHDMQQQQQPQQQQQLHEYQQQREQEEQVDKAQVLQPQEVGPQGVVKRGKNSTPGVSRLNARGQLATNSKQKARKLTRLDNNGRIVGYVAPVLQQQQQEPPAAASASASAAASSQKSCTSSSSRSQQHQPSQISVCSDVRRAQQGLHAQQAALTEGGPSRGPLGAPKQFANYGVLMALEVIADCRPHAVTEAAAAAAVPNPWNCSVLAVCFILRDERLQLCAARQQQQQQKQQQYHDVKGVIMWDSVASVPGPSSKARGLDVCTDKEWLSCIVASEKDLLLQFCALVAAADPTLVIQWEAGARGLTFLSKRAQALGLGQLFGDRCSRRADDVSSPVNPAARGPPSAAVVGGGAAAAAPGFRRRRPWARGSAAVSGRLVLEAWRLLQREIKLQHSDLSGVAAEVLGIVSPTVPSAVIAALWQQGQQARKRSRMQQQQLQQKQQQQLQQEELWGLTTIGATLRHVMDRVELTLRLLDWSEVIPRTCELSRLYGCCLHAALTRGSQFKVENVLIRATKKLHAVLVSPSKKQVTEQPATVCVPLVLEPLSGFYFSPVLVLDFLSLYPSIVIANNICYSTCLGSVEVDPLESETKPLGVVTYHAPPQIFLDVLRAHAEAKAAGACSWGTYAADEEALRVLPGGSVFVSRRVRQGVLPAVLNDMLQTRLMVKQAAKRYGFQRRLLTLRTSRLRDTEELPPPPRFLKWHETCGYTNANVSGRMPCAEVADSIVQTARTTLLRAMQLIEETERQASCFVACFWWNAKVLYGDTDSVFVLLKGRSLETAFQIGKEIAEAVTRSNPPPIQLQLEKVFLPCCLVTKKRYVGNAYHSPSGPPTFDAKGIETIRRDQCPLTSALLENSLRILFETRDLSKVKELLYRQWSKVLRGQVPIRHFIFQRKAKLGSYRAETGDAPAGTLPPQAKVLYERLYQRGGGEGGEGSPAALASLYGCRVSYVFSHVAGDTDIPVGSPGTGTAKGGGRLIDAATAPENVWGGRRGHRDVQALLRGRVFPAIPPLPLAVQDEDELQQQEQAQLHPVMQLHYRYYITKQIIPALDRLFSLLPPPATADLPQWFREMPKPAPRSMHTPAGSSGAPVQQQQQHPQQQSLLHTLGIRSITAGSGAARERLVLQRFFASASCILCGSKCRELGPTALRQCGSRSSRMSASSVHFKRRKVGAPAKPEETQELAVRRGLLLRLHKAAFSCSSSSFEEGGGNTSSESPPAVKEKRRRQPVDVSKVRELLPPPVCRNCSRNPAAVCVAMFQRLKKVEERVAASRNMCARCAGSRVYAEACLHAWYCDVYFRRISEANKMHILQQQMHNLGFYTDN